MYIMYNCHSALLPVAMDSRHGNFDVPLLVGNHSLTVVNPLLMNNVPVMGH
jgi:hypothetical protein